ncbi:MAG TPA: prepilin-type N-terminal cleavage/methylation domain-containing protein [bacterium]|nr:prepilin-type N-terminal cleavage/methylation domain-containing protein [bacterium]HQO36537.1 prepilin-type N-terminal cleavage/methylation domain-containing protein [bacterium]HQP99027.1 prepilin-type N-terminal cleavage/methylation domain-containing protein [bacterium]
MRPAFQRGFTLVELILVLTIMGLLSTTIAPVMKNLLQAQRLPNAATMLASSIRYCRSTAVHRSALTRLIFDTELGQLRIETESSPLTQPGVFEEVPLPIGLQKELEECVSEIQIKQMAQYGTEDVEQLEFQPDGVIVGPTGTISDTFIYLKGENESEVYTIAVVGITGQVLVMDHEASTFYDEL